MTGTVAAPPLPYLDVVSVAMEPRMMFISTWLFASLVLAARASSTNASLCDSSNCTTEIKNETSTSEWPSTSTPNEQGQPIITEIDKGEKDYLPRKKQKISTEASSSTIIPTSSTNRDSKEDDGYYKLCYVEGCHCPHKNEINSALLKLDCTNKNLISVPPYLHVPDNILHASFRGNILSKITNMDFQFVMSIEYLDMSHNSVSDVELGSFSNFERLHELDLGHNMLQVLRQGAFSGLQSLNSLFLDNNKLTSLDPAVFRDLIGLKKLSLKMNPLTILRSDLFEYLSDLEEIRLESTKLASLPDSIFFGLKHLKVLDLEGNFFEAVPKVALENLSSISSLYLGNNPIKVFDQHSFPFLKNLHFLFLDSLHNLEEIGPHALGKMPMLKVLHCSHNPELKRIDAAAFLPAVGGSVPRLSLVYLRHNALETLNRSLLEWDLLYMADLSGNPWQCDCHLSWMTTIRTQSASKTRCASPPELQGRSVNALSEEFFQCHSSELRRWMFLTLCSFMVLATLVVIGVLGVALVRCGGCPGRALAAKQFDYRPVSLTVSDTA